jgi:ATP-binding cassette subfamily F protein uup
MEYTGTLLLVSHDREFLNNVVTGTLAVSVTGEVREYVGGYDDWLRQATAETPIAPATNSPKLQARPKQQAERPRKLAFKEERELETLPERIAALEAEQEKLHGTLADPEFYRSAGAGVAQLTIRLEELERELAGSYQRWEELEVMKG